MAAAAAPSPASALLSSRVGLGTEGRRANATGLRQTGHEPITRHETVQRVIPVKAVKASSAWLLRPSQANGNEPGHTPTIYH